MGPQTPVVREGGPTPSDATAEPSAAWEEHAEAAVAAIQTSLEPRLRKAADDLYGDLLYSVQDYLRENVLYNVKSEIDAANRQANADRARATAAERRVEALEAVLRETRRLVSKCADSGFVDTADVTALFVNNGAITAALAGPVSQ